MSHRRICLTAVVVMISISLCRPDGDHRGGGSADLGIATLFSPGRLYAAAADQEQQSDGKKKGPDTALSARGVAARNIELGRSGQGAVLKESTFPGEARDPVPVDAGMLKRFKEVRYRSIRNVLSLPQLYAAVRDDSGKLTFDLNRIADPKERKLQLLDGRTIRPARVYGLVQVGPYPFEAEAVDYTYKRFRRNTSLENGRGVIDVGYLMSGDHNSEDWFGDVKGQVCVRVQLHLERRGRDMTLGTYDLFVSFDYDAGQDKFRKLASVVDGPFVNVLGPTGDDPTSAVIWLITDEEAPVTLTVHKKSGSINVTHQSGRRHFFELANLEPDRDYTYTVSIDGRESKEYTFHTPPAKGTVPASQSVRFAYVGDSREGVGAGEHNFMGVNFDVLHRHAARAKSKDLDFFAFGGDLVNGYTTGPRDFDAQLHAWKQAMSGLWHEVSVYPAMGNHEALIRYYEAGDATGYVDRFPYQKESAEAHFARAFVNPVNGPAPENRYRPAYSENVYAYQYGRVLMVAFNNNYWIASAGKMASPTKPGDKRSLYALVGGSPEGYIFDDQMDWIEETLAKAESDDSVDYVFLYAQEPVFPCGGHVDDAMWWEGDNNVRGYQYRHAADDGSGTRSVVPEEEGIIELRNRFVQAVGASSKVAAVFGSDEHSYYRVRIDKTVPIGRMSDDADGDGVIEWRDDEAASPLYVPNATLYITSGGAGAPYYSIQQTPWTNHWVALQGGNPKDLDTFHATRESHADPDNSGLFYTSEQNFLLIEAGTEDVSITVYNPYGEVIDQIDDVMASKFDADPVIDASVVDQNADLTLRRGGENVELVDAHGLLLLNQPLAATNSITIRSAELDESSLSIDFTHGGDFDLPGGVHVQASD